MKEKFKYLYLEIESLLSNERNFISNASNFAAHLFSKLENVSWLGFYFNSNGDLLLGPFAGKPACSRLPHGKGVCGSSFITKKTIIVGDVHQFPGHIACDDANNSEIVVPLIKDDIAFGVLDLDSLSFDRFNDDDKESLEALVKILIQSSDTEALIKYYNS